jgi:excisionase family DNA binding protein
MLNYNSTDPLFKLTIAEFFELMIQTRPEQKLPIEISNYSDIISLEQACDFLNFKKPTLYKYTSRKLIPHYKQGGTLFFSKSELEAWIKSGKILTISEQVCLTKKNLKKSDK